MLTNKETANALYGLSRLIRLDPDGFKFFNASLEGFWNSYWVALFVAPVYILQNIAVLSDGESDGPVLAFLLVDFFTYVMGWVLFPLVMIRISSLLDRWPNYFRYMVAYNWFQLVISLILLPLVIANLVTNLPIESLSPLYFVIGLATLLYTWFLASKGLAVGGFTAVGIVILDMLLSALISGVAATMLGS